MNKKAPRVSVREKKMKNGKLSLYLDIYPQVYNHAKGKLTRREFLGLYLFAKPRNESEKDHNKTTKALAEKRCLELQNEVQNDTYGVKEYQQGSFLNLITEQAEQAGKSKRIILNCVSKALKQFAKTDYIEYTSITKDFTENFKKYLQKNTSYKGNTPRNYFNNFKTMLNVAYEKKLIPTKIEVESIKASQTQREYLTKTELEILAKTECDKPNWKNAFLFACLTGLRYSDLVALRWENLKVIEGKTCIAHTQQKTKKVELLPVPENALKYIGEQGNPKDKIFTAMSKRTDINLQLRLWALRAGIDKKLTFHSARHTYATLQLTLGTDLYTVSELLGHSNISTTKIYAKITDSSKRKAVNKLDDLDI